MRGKFGLESECQNVGYIFMRWIQTTVTNLSFLKLWANVNLDQDLNFPFPTSPLLKWQFFAQLKLRYIGVLITKRSHLTAVIFFFPGNILFSHFQNLLGCFLWLGHWSRYLMSLNEPRLLQRRSELRPTRGGWPCKSMASESMPGGKGKGKISIFRKKWSCHTAKKMLAWKNMGKTFGGIGQSENCQQKEVDLGRLDQGNQGRNKDLVGLWCFKKSTKTCVSFL